MIRLLLCLAVLCLALTASVLAVVRAQPYDDQPLREALFTPDCAPPCFIGIRPGVTTRNEALAILQAHPWIATVEPLLGERGLTWTWSGQQPSALRGGHTENSILLGDGIVRRIDLLTGENLADYLIVMGKPDQWEVSSWSSGSPATNIFRDYLLQVVTYDAYQMEVSALGLCPLGLRDRWALSTHISLFAPQGRGGFTTTYFAPGEVPLHTLSGGCP
jgi:hypothetical protein